MTKRRWSDADRDLVRDQIVDALDLDVHPHDPDPGPADRAADKVLDALTADGKLGGHCPGCECPDVPNTGSPPTRQLTIGDADAD